MRTKKSFLYVKFLKLIVFRSIDRLLTGITYHNQEKKLILNKLIKPHDKKMMCVFLKVNVINF